MHKFNKQLLRLRPPTHRCKHRQRVTTKIYPPFQSTGSQPVPRRFGAGKLRLARAPAKQNGTVSHRDWEESASTIQRDAQAGSRLAYFSLKNSNAQILPAPPLSALDVHQSAQSAPGMHARQAHTLRLSTKHTLVTFSVLFSYVLGAWPPRLPYPGRRSFSCCCFSDSVPSLWPYLKDNNIGKITEGNHIQGNLFLLPKLINTAPPLLW